MKWVVCLLLLCGFIIQSAFGQTSDTPANVYSPLVDDTYDNLSVEVSTTGLLPPVDDFSNLSNVTDNNLTNSASSGSIGLLSTIWLEVTDIDATGDEVHPAGSYVGFVINDVVLGALGSTTITTYLGGTQQESVSGSSLLGGALGSGNAKVGIVTTEDFNRVRITFSSLASLGSREIYYAEILTPSDADTPDEEINESTPLLQADTTSNTDGYPVIIEPSNTGLSGVSVGSISNVQNVVDSDHETFGTISLNLGVGASGSISVRKLGQVFPAGYFAGFEIQNTNLLGIGLLGGLEITTYLNGTQQEQISGSNLILSLPLLSDTGRHTVGFQTSADFDEIQITVHDALLSVDLGSIGIYHAVVTQYSAGISLQCNTNTSMVLPEYPVLVNGENTGFTGGACTGCSINNSDNVINGTPNEGAEIDLVAGAATTGSISVKDALTDYPGGTFVGFDIENSSLLNVDALSGFTITTYLNGEEQESVTGDNALLTVNTDLLTSEGRRTLGFVTNDPFDEVQISTENLVDVDLGTTTVYQLFLRELCAGTLECSETTFLTIPDYPAVVNAERTGIFGGACVDCTVQNADALISASNTDFATITTTVDVLGYGSVSVFDPLTEYAAGSTAGFVIDTGTSNLVELDLLEVLEICTYNNGTQQECLSGSDLLTLTLLIPLIGSADGVFNVGFVTSQPLDEIQLRAGDLTAANVLDESIDVYSAFVEVYEIDGSPCPPIEITLTQQACYRMLSSPVVGLTYQQMLDDLWTQGVPNSDYPPAPETNIFSWPLGSTDNAVGNWEPLNGSTTGLNTEIPAGTGFLISVFEDDDYEANGIQGDFSKTISIPAGPQSAVTLEGSNINQNADGWTLAGNPLQSNINVTQLITNDLTEAFYVYNTNAGGGIGGWVSNVGSFGDLMNDAIAVGQGFFIQNNSSPSDPSLTISDAAATTSGQFYGKENERRDYVRLEMAGEKASGSAWIRFSEEGSFSKVYGDALQLMPFSDDFAILASQKGDELMDIGHYPFFSQDGAIKIPVHAESTIPGTYIITATELDLPPHLELYLKDLQTGESVKITNNFEYSFEINQINQINKQDLPDQGLSCSDLRQKPIQAKAKTSEPRFIITNGVSVSSQPPGTDLPSEFKLEQNYPNPFNPTTNINYQLPQESNILLQVFDITGRHITTLVEGTMPAGSHSVNFDASTLSSGVYIYKLQAESINLTRKFTLIK